MFKNLFHKFYFVFGKQTVKTNYSVSFFKILNSSIFVGKFIPFQLVLFKRGLIFKTFSEFFQIFSLFRAIVKEY